MRAIATSEQVAIIRAAYDNAEKPSDPRAKGVWAVKAGTAARLARQLGLTVNSVSEIGRRKSYTKLP